MVGNRRERKRGKVVMDGQKLRGEKPREVLAQTETETEKDSQSLDQQPVRGRCGQSHPHSGPSSGNRLKQAWPRSNLESW